MQTGKLATKNGTLFETNDGMPCGSFATLQIGTKVIVTKLNNGSLGAVIAKLPWTDEASWVLSSVAKQQST